MDGRCTRVRLAGVDEDMTDTNDRCAIASIAKARLFRRVDIE
jgi:hypothetical protein